MKGKKEKGIHDGHRKRLQFSVTNDPEFETLSDFQTLEYLLGYFIPRGDVNPLAHELIDKFGSLYNVFQSDPEELIVIKGITQKVANFFPNLFAIARKAEYSRRERGAEVTNTREGVEVLRPYFLGRNNEKLYILMLDINDKIIGINCVSQGNAHVTRVDIEAIVSRVAKSHAVKVMIAHNHPAGNNSPSYEDIAATENLAIIFNAMGKILLDHVIFFNDDYYSFHERDLLTDILKKIDYRFEAQTHEAPSLRFYVNNYVYEDKKGDKREDKKEEKDTEA